MTLNLIFSSFNFATLLSFLMRIIAFKLLIINQFFYYEMLNRIPAKLVQFYS